MTKDEENDIDIYYTIQEKVYGSVLIKICTLKLVVRHEQIFILLQIAFEIQTLHATGYTRQDIRPENIPQMHYHKHS